MSAEFTCGPLLDYCRCQARGPVALSPAAMELRHEEAVKRAERSRWAAKVRESLRPDKPKRRAA